MSLVEYRDKRSKVSWSDRDKRATRHRIPGDVKSPVIDYSKLKELCSLDGLPSSQGSQSSPDCHKSFMQLYPDIFVREAPRTGLPTHSLSRSLLKASQTSLATGVSRSVVNAGKTTSAHKHLIVQPQQEEQTDDVSHDVREWLPMIHKQRKSKEPVAVKADRIKHLRKLLKKLSFERTAAENDEIYCILKHFPRVTGEVSPAVLKELCAVAQLDSWKEPEITLFGNTGFHMVLRGTLQPQTMPYILHAGETPRFRIPTPEPDEDLPELSVGDCFGTLVKVEGRDANSRILTVSTLDANVDLLKISCSDYSRVIEQIKQRDLTEKINLMQSCNTYKMWSKQPLMRLADLLQWTPFPPNTVLASEGFRAPFVAIIKSGECHILRHVDVLHSLPNGKKERRKKQVVMGKLGTTHSFGEISVVDHEPMSCSIVTATDVKLAFIEPDHLGELDGVTLQLLVQSSERTYGTLGKDEIHEEYIAQELKREWNEFKHNVVVDIINSRGIRPGYGKWAK